MLETLFAGFGILTVWTGLYSFLVCKVFANVEELPGKPNPGDTCSLETPQG